jgi:choline dehydrogenase-like flavoprotein
VARGVDSASVSAGFIVVDASVMPTIPRANINLTCSMIAEHASARTRDDA